MTFRYTIPRFREPPLHLALAIEGGSAGGRCEMTVIKIYYFLKEKRVLVKQLRFLQEKKMKQLLFIKNN